MTTTSGTHIRGRYERVTDPSGERCLLHAVPSGYLGFSPSMVQGAYAPKRERVRKERFASQADAVAAFERMAETIRRAGLR